MSRSLLLFVVAIVALTATASSFLVNAQTTTTAAAGGAVTTTAGGDVPAAVVGVQGQLQSLVQNSRIPTSFVAATVIVVALVIIIWIDKFFPPAPVEDLPGRERRLQLIKPPRAWTIPPMTHLEKPEGEEGDEGDEEEAGFPSNDNFYGNSASNSNYFSQQLQQFQPQNNSVNAADFGRGANQNTFSLDAQLLSSPSSGQHQQYRPAASYQSPTNAMADYQQQLSRGGGGGSGTYYPNSSQSFDQRSARSGNSRR